MTATVLTEKSPYVPPGLKLHRHHGGCLQGAKQGKFSLYLSEEQKTIGSVLGQQFHAQVKVKSNADAVTLDDWFDNQHKIPKECCGKHLCFFGTEYLCEGALVIRCLSWREPDKKDKNAKGGWYKTWFCLENFPFDQNYFAVLIEPIVSA